MGPHSNSALDRRSGEPLWGDNTELNLRLGRSQPRGELGASEQGGLGLDQCGGPWSGGEGADMILGARPTGFGSHSEDVRLDFTCNGELLTEGL